jgi:hypothetical protein
VFSQTPAPRPAVPDGPGHTHDVPAGGRGPYRVRPRLGQAAAAAVLMAALGLGVAACGGGSSPGASSPSSPAASAASAPRSVPAGIAATIQNASAADRTAFAQCMRKNGLPNFPSSLTLTALHAAGITIRSSSFQTAARTCWTDLTR